MKKFRVGDRYEDRSGGLSTAQEEKVREGGGLESRGDGSSWAVLIRDRDESAAGGEEISGKWFTLCELRGNGAGHKTEKGGDSSAGG